MGLYANIRKIELQGEQKLNNSRRTTSNSTNDDLFPNSFRENRNSELSQ